MKIINDNNLTSREKDIVLLILSGKNKREIAEILSLSISTIKTNTENLYRKWNVHNKVQFIVYIIKNNIIEFDENN